MISFFVRLFLTGLAIVISLSALLAQDGPMKETRVSIESEGWELVGDFMLPESKKLVSAVLLLNKANGSREVYKNMAIQLANRGIASLRLDLRGHGESTNLGRFVPGETDSIGIETIIWQSDFDIVSAHHYLKSLPQLDSNRIAIVGASYSGEEMAEAGRKNGYAQAYVALSPGSFSNESIAEMDRSGVPWLFVVSKDERFLHEIVAEVQTKTTSVEILYLPGEQHATRILEARSDVAERIAVWLEKMLAN